MAFTSDFKKKKVGKYLICFYEICMLNFYFYLSYKFFLYTATYILRNCHSCVVVVISKWHGSSSVVPMRIYVASHIQMSVILIHNDDVDDHHLLDYDDDNS